MSEFLSARTGPYMHHPKLKWPLVFESEDGGKRHFTVLVASAYNAGIVGPENNGIVVLDEDNSNVVLDRHLEQPSGYHGPSSAQLVEAQRILEMKDWATFVAYCQSNPRYREGSIPDAAAPEYVYPDPDAEKVLVSDEMAAADAQAGVHYPARTRGAIREALLSHSFHRSEPYDDFRLSWNIKVYGKVDTSGHHPDFQNDPAFDERWQQHMAEGDEVFWRACEQALSVFVEGEFTTFPGDDQGDYQFGVQGCNGGHLVLTGFKYYDEKDLKWASKADFEEFLDELDDAELLALYRLDRHVAQATANPEQALAYEYASIRSAMEVDWRMDSAPAPRPMRMR